jgi:hypothetical protein
MYNFKQKGYKHESNKDNLGNNMYFNHIRLIWGLKTVKKNKIV